MKAPAARAPRTVIVGAGITGLAAAHALSRSRRDGLAVLEAGARSGGNVKTRREGDYLIDEGPDGFVRSKPHAEVLCRTVGLGDELIETVAAHRRVYGVHRRALVPFPAGLALIAPTQLRATLATPLLSAAGKARLALDLVLPRGGASLGHEESLGAFVSRRLGREVLDAFGESILAGIYAGDPETLSVLSTFPQLVAMEREHGSLIRAALAARKAQPKRSAGAPPPSAFLSLRGGMGRLPETVAAKLSPGTVRTNARAVALERLSGAGWRVVLASGDAVEADAVVLAVPSHAAAALLAPHDARLAALLGGIEHLSTATVFLAYERGEVSHPLDATGFVISRRERFEITASTWASSKWEGRAPAGRVLLRAFFGGARAPRATERDDGELIAIARRELGELMGITARPHLARVFRYVRASPQPALGHSVRMAEVSERLRALGGVHAGGGGYLGVGIPDCVKQGEALAEAVLAGARAGIHPA